MNFFASQDRVRKNTYQLVLLFSLAVVTLIIMTNLAQLKQEIEMVISVMAYAGHQDQNDVEDAFGAATKTLELGGFQLVAETEINLSNLDIALQKLENLRPLAKPQLLKACAASVMHDQEISPIEVELLRAFSAVLDCPMPPIIPS